MKLKVLIIAFISLFLFSCNIEDINKDINVFEKELIVYSDDDAQDRVTKNFTLVLDVEGIKVNWSSSDTSVIQIIGGDAIVTRKNSNQLITLTASYDYNENEVRSKKFPIIVIGRNESDDQDTTPPTITGRESVELKKGSSVNLLSLVEVQDNKDTEVSVKIKESNLDINTLGSYTVVFEAEDSAGNKAQFTITVNVVEDVVEDILAPTIHGATDMEITVGSTIDLLAFVYAIDDVDDDVAVTIKSSDLDVNQVGDYTVVYQAEDAAGNKATLEITIKVVAVETKATYTEDFSKLPVSGSTYTKGSFVGNHNITWTYTGIRGDQKLDDKALTFGGSTDDYSSIKATLSGGISLFRAELQKGFTNTNLRRIALIINDDIVEEFTLDSESTAVQIFEVELDVFGEYTIEIAQVDTSSSRAQIVIDNIVIVNNPKSTLPLEQQNLNRDFEQLNIQISFIEAGKISLPNLGAFSSLITWKYNNLADPNNSYIDLTTLAVTLPSQGIVEVKLDAVLVNGAFTSTKTFTIKVGEGDPVEIESVFNVVDEQKVKIKGVVSSVFETSTGKRFFIQDESKGILVYLSNSYNVEVGDEVELIAQKLTANNVVYLANISKLTKISDKTANIIELTNHSLDTLEGKLVNLNALLKFTYGNVNKFILVNEYNEFDIYIDESLNNSASIKSLINGKSAGLEVDLFGIVYKEGGKLSIYVTAASDVEVASNLNLTRIDNLIHGYINFPKNNDEVSKNLNLITEDEVFIDLRVEWNSSNTNVLSNQGVIYQTDVDVNVVLTYKIYVDNILISTHSVTIIVLEKTSFSGYYASIEGLTGSALKDELKSIISKMKSIGYSSTSFIIEDSDIDLTKSNQLLLIYTRTNVKNVWDGASSWNKEHIWPQSKLGGASKSDIHNLRAANPGVNSSRGNHAFVEGSGSYGKKSGGWYPGDDDKGDVARIVLYMNVRWGLTINSSIGNLDMFLRWHIEDPVDDFEIHRNQVIYEAQNNRNPFIDHPELVEMIYGKAKLLSVEVEEPTESYYLDFTSIHDVDLLNRRVVFF